MEQRTVLDEIKVVKSIRVYSFLNWLVFGISDRTLAVQLPASAKLATIITKRKGRQIENSKAIIRFNI